jgi:hypothetical protein
LLRDGVLKAVGLVAGMCRKLELAERIDALLPAEGRKVVAMPLHALDFVSWHHPTRCPIILLM